MNKTGQGMMIAAAVAALLASGSIRAAETSDAKATAGIHCWGINNCKGLGNCNSNSNTCKGMNTCKGKGWLEVSRAECKEKHGRVVRAKRKKMMRHAG